ncbi:MAG TPA: aspartate--tRNA(Asn) ligase [Nitrososphaeraceae archaeon]|nr:aspartate--tRNA(Asn) ligase [Nitrososphaeraceae archaeon]
MANSSMTFDIHRSHFANQINENLLGQKVRIGGWVEDTRDIGKLAFAIIRDVTGSVQVIANDDDNLQLLKNIPRQSAVIVSGLVQKGKAKGFSVEVKVQELIVLSRAVHPLPIDPTGRVESANDKRLDSRALDLRNPRIAAIFRVRSMALHIIRKTLSSKDFIEVHTPKIIGSASEGGSNLFGFPYFKKKAYLAQSPQLYKEQLILALDRVFEIGPYFRAENSHTVRHLNEFISVDLEAAFLDYEDIMDIVEEVIRNIISELRKNCKSELESVASDQIAIPIYESSIDRLTYEQCLKELVREGEELKFGDDLSDASLRKLGAIHPGFYFITDWPTSLKPFYIYENEDDPRISKSFDLQYGYLELVSGGRRQHDSLKLRARLVKQGLDPIDFSEHLEAFNWGMPPHSGCGLGFDRLMMVLLNSQNIRDVVLYPRDTERISP